MKGTATSEVDYAIHIIRSNNIHGPKISKAANSIVLLRLMTKLDFSIDAKISEAMHLVQNNDNRLVRFIND